jgi:MFS family permease
MLHHTAATAPSRRPVAILLAANAISWTGNVLANMAIPWFVLSTTGSATKTGITAFFTFLPTIGAALFGGAIVDRWGYKRTSMLADITSGFTVALIPLLHSTVGVAFWQLQVLVFMGALLDAPGSTARDALLPDVTKHAHLRVERTTALNDAIQRSARLVGAPIAGVGIAVLGPTLLLWIDAATFFVSALLVAVWIPTPTGSPPVLTTPTANRSTYWSDLKEGIRFIGQDRLLTTMIAVVMITNFVDTSWSAVVQLVYVNALWGSAVYLGWLSVVFGIAALSGAMFFGMVGPHLPRRPTYICLSITAGLRYWVFATFPDWSMLLVMQAMTGLSVAPLNPLMQSTQFERIPHAMRARVLGTMTAGVFAAIPLGVLCSGYVIEHVGLRSTLLMLGLVHSATTCSLIVNPALRQLNRSAVSQGEATQ